ncbi:cytochrome c peroxidase [Chitinophaga niabensis]|uniref:cytochrome-c peroxidase n=1 Tax=Chitinophaga niabensis TaxID=536979 RepID=UPI0031BB2FE0
MKIKVLIVLLGVFLLIQWQISGCNNRPEKGDAAVKEYFFNEMDTLLDELDKLDVLTDQKKPVAVLQGQFANCRFTYKKIEAVVEYYFQGVTKRINGPALPDVKTEDGVVWPPAGFQVIEQFLYDRYNDSLQPALSDKIKTLQTDLKFIKDNMQYISITGNHVKEMLQHQLIRVACMGITGFDAPLSKLSLQESGYSLQGIEKITLLYTGEADADTRKKVADAIQYLWLNNEFDNFDRLNFITSHLMPLSDILANAVPDIDRKMDSLVRKPFTGTLTLLMQGKGLNADYYSPYEIAKSNPEKVLLGKKLFFDTRLSRSNTISCASCHQPQLFFTDGKEKAGNFVHGGSLQRNTPTLYYAGFQSSQFYDLRSPSLEDQAHEVMKSSDEFNFSSAAIARKIAAEPEYIPMFKKAFNTDSIGGFEVRNAMAAFVRSLAPFSSSFDEYMRGNKRALSSEQIRGFNLFAGKAKCATCHFIPVFNGNIPPWYTKSESEIIGVPVKAVWENAVIDPDSGRYQINHIPELMFSFKTTTVRNAEKTGPYMHNGVFKTLDDVIEFYHKGGGAGIGINLPAQTLPFDSLTLNDNEKKSMIAFINGLTDKSINY